jgi:hypothetical protein
MADVKDHLDLMQANIDMMRVVAKLMQSAEEGDHFELGKHGPILLANFTNMMLSLADTMEEGLKDIDLAISIKGHEKK